MTLRPTDAARDASRNEAAVSIILATSRDSAYLREALDSVRAQTYPFWELLVVDNGACHPEAIAELIRDDPRMSLITIDHSATLGLARNIGVAHTHAALITFLDDDDVWHPERLTAHTAAHRAHPMAPASFSGFWYMDADGNPFGTPWMSHEAPSADILRGAAPTPFSPALMVTRPVYATVGGFSPEIPLLEDFEFALRLALQGDLIYIDRALYGYRRHDGNMTSTEPANMRKGRFIMEQIILRQLWAARYRGARATAHLLSERLRDFHTTEGDTAGVAVLRYLRRRDLRSAGAEAKWAMRRTPWRFAQSFALAAARKTLFWKKHK